MNTFLQKVNSVFQQSGDCYGETITSVNWSTLNSTEYGDREEEAYKVVVEMSPSGSGFLWIKHKEDGVYIGWETELATHKLNIDQICDMLIDARDYAIDSIK